MIGIFGSTELFDKQKENNKLVALDTFLLFLLVSYMYCHHGSYMLGKVTISGHIKRVRLLLDGHINCLNVR